MAQVPPVQKVEIKMNLAYIMTSERGATDRLLSALAGALADAGLRTAGIVQTNIECGDTALCDMDVRVLPDGQTIRISQSLGRQSRGCRLNPEALEQAVAQVQNSLIAKTTPDVLLVNKFGKHEADGRGMREVIAEALALDIPVISGVNRLNFDAFQEFACGEAEAAPHEISELVAWVKKSKTHIE